MPVIPEIGRLRPEIPQFKASLLHRETLSQKKKKKKTAWWHMPVIPATPG
jgi:hypothetical protein